MLDLVGNPEAIYIYMLCCWVFFFRVLLSIPLDVSGCSPQRKKIFEDAYIFLSEVESLQCQKSYLQGSRSCDIAKIEQCLENFRTFLNFASASEDACTYAALMFLNT